MTAQKAIYSFLTVVKTLGDSFNPNWHEAGQFYPPCNFGIEFCQLKLYQKFPNVFGGEIDINRVN